MLSLLYITLLSLTLASGVYSDDKISSASTQVKWSRVPDDGTLTEEMVLSSLGFHTKTFGAYNGRAFLQEADENDASLVIMDATVSDSGRYRCEAVKGMEDAVYYINVQVAEDSLMDGTAADGVVFPYSPRGRYNLNFHDAQQACWSQDAVVASYDQLEKAWRGGLDWCNAGWLSDGTVQYPIVTPRDRCGGSGSNAGLRTYGQPDKNNSRFDVYCFTTQLEGQFFWLDQPERLTYDEAVQACLDDGATIAKVSHIYAAWKLHGYDRCDAGWLDDGSVRYPISKPRKNCSPLEAAVRFIGFPNKKQKLYGVYCFKPQ
ncbi:Hyaluronan and proteoglycan link protein 1 [Merluccius polli]|uniref:Hyaluronan and proteoglycan link protein 1 n=1 Tax=Merluccius polli TaxID=89951 RepID=A0AA47M0K6_MERPO|nr:Hyaluronan and proteoglycan link protein 1 [Merluccius polli]